MTDDKRILVVEDDALIAMDLEDELADRGFEPVCVSSCRGAVRWLETERPLFAILDMHLRSETSFDLAKLLQKQGVPFIFLSGSGPASLPDDLASCTVLTKPVQMDDIIKIIRAIEEKR